MSRNLFALLVLSLTTITVFAHTAQRAALPFQRMLLFPGTYTVGNDLINNNITIPAFCIDKDADPPTIDDVFRRGTSNITVVREYNGRRSNPVSIDSALKSWLKVTGENFYGFYGSYCWIAVKKRNPNDRYTYTMIVTERLGVVGPLQGWSRTGFGQLERILPVLTTIYSYYTNNLVTESIEDRSEIMNVINHYIIWSAILHNESNEILNQRLDYILTYYTARKRLTNLVGEESYLNRRLDLNYLKSNWATGNAPQRSSLFLNIIPGIVQKLNRYEDVITITPPWELPDTAGIRYINTLTGLNLRRPGTSLALITSRLRQPPPRRPVVIRFSNADDFYNFIGTVCCEAELCLSNEEASAALMCNDVGFEAKASNEGLQISLKMKHANQSIAINLFNSNAPNTLPDIVDTSNEFRQLQAVREKRSTTPLAYRYELKPLEFLSFLKQNRQSTTDSCRSIIQICLTISSRGRMEPKGNFEWKCGTVSTKISTKGEMSLSIEKDGVTYEINLNNEDDDCDQP